MNLNGATHDRYDSNPPPTERDPMVAPETLSAIGRAIVAVGEHVANVERQQGSFRAAVWEELKEQEKAAKLDSEKLSALRIEFHRFQDDATQTMEITKALCERILAKLNQA